MLGHGGVAVVARRQGVSRVTVTGGVRELEAGDEPLGRTRRCGGGRKSVTKTDPGLKAALLALVEPESHVRSGVCETHHLTRHDFHGESNYTVSPANQP